MLKNMKTGDCIETSRRIRRVQNVSNEYIRTGIIVRSLRNLVRHFYPVKLPGRVFKALKNPPELHPRSRIDPPALYWVNVSTRPRQRSGDLPAAATDRS